MRDVLDQLRYAIIGGDLALDPLCLFLFLSLAVDQKRPSFSPDCVAAAVPTCGSFPYHANLLGEENAKSIHFCAMCGRPYYVIYF
jgi:hypothetical protein